MSKPQPLFRIRTIAVAEVFLAIGLLIVINLFYFNGDRFTGLNPHPFWFVVILISAQYGVAEGVFAVVIATAAFLIGNVRPRGEGEYIYSYLLDVNSQPLLWLISAVILGCLRFRHVMERDRLKNDLAEAIRRDEIVATQYEQQRMIRETLEQRLVSHANTVVDTYKAARLMETLQPGKILEGVEDLVTSLLRPRQFSVFTLNGDSLEASLSHAWGKTDEYTRVIHSQDRLFEEVIANKRILCIADEGDELILSHQGMLAGPIMAESGQILGMLKIEKMDYTDLTISTLQTFRIVCSWIGNAYYQAQDFQKASNNSFINPINDLYSYEFFKHQADYTTYLSQRFNFDLTAMMVKILPDPNATDEIYRQGMKMLLEAVMKNLRKADRIFNYQVTDYTYYILLPGTSDAFGQQVIQKISDVFDKMQKNNAVQLKLSLSFQSLNRKKQGT